MSLGYDEAFFDSVIRQIGGQRLTERFTPPPDTRSVDYLVGEYALELKTLEFDPLGRVEHQAAIKALFSEAYGSGDITPVQDGKEFNLGGVSSQRFWKILGKPVRRALEDAQKQIVASKIFLPGQWFGAVLLVNAGAISLSDPYSFIRLIADYHHDFPQIDTIFSFNAIPSVNANGSPAVSNAIMSHETKHELIGISIERAIQDEVFKRTGWRGIDNLLDVHAPGTLAQFKATPEGLKKVWPQKI